MDSEEKLFSNVAVKKEEIFDPGEDQTQLTVGNGRKSFVKEETVDTAEMKKEIEDEAEGEMVEKPVQRRSGRVAKPKEFYGDFVGFEEESKEIRRKYQKKEKAKRFPRSRMAVSDVGASEAENEDEDVDQAAEEDQSEGSGNDEKRCPVDGCAEKLDSLEDLVEHMKTHPKPMICGMCKSSWRDGYDLRRHCMTHTGEKPFNCDVCDKTFRHVSHLHIHQRIHTGERPYKCDECGYKASKRDALNVHKRKHTGESYLKNHQLTHTGEKAYVCTTCGYKAAISSNLSRHRKRHSH